MREEKNFEFNYVLVFVMSNYGIYTASTKQLKRRKTLSFTRTRFDNVFTSRKLSRYRSDFLVLRRFLENITVALVNGSRNFLVLSATASRCTMCNSATRRVHFIIFSRLNRSIFCEILFTHSGKGQRGA